MASPNHPWYWKLPGRTQTGVYSERKKRAWYFETWLEDIGVLTLEFTRMTVQIDSGVEWSQLWWKSLLANDPCQYQWWGITVRTNFSVQSDQLVSSLWCFLLIEPLGPKQKSGIQRANKLRKPFLCLFTDIAFGRVNNLSDTQKAAPCTLIMNLLGCFEAFPFGLIWMAKKPFNFPNNRIGAWLVWFLINFLPLNPTTGL